jgi:hypothetical protein
MRIGGKGSPTLAESRPSHRQKPTPARRATLAQPPRHRPVKAAPSRHPLRVTQKSARQPLANSATNRATMWMLAAYRGLPPEWFPLPAGPIFPTPVPQLCASSRVFHSGLPTPRPPLAPPILTRGNPPASLGSPLPDPCPTVQTASCLCAPVGRSLAVVGRTLAGVGTTLATGGTSLAAVGTSLTTIGRTRAVDFLSLTAVGRSLAGDFLPLPTVERAHAGDILSRATADSSLTGDFRSLAPVGKSLTTAGTSLINDFPPLTTVGSSMADDFLPRAALGSSFAHRQPSPTATDPTLTNDRPSQAPAQSFPTHFEPRAPSFTWGRACPRSSASRAPRVPKCNLATRAQK